MARYRIEGSDEALFLVEEQMPELWLAGNRRSGTMLSRACLTQRRLWLAGNRRSGTILFLVEEQMPDGAWRERSRLRIRADAEFSANYVAHYLMGGIQPPNRPTRIWMLRADGELAPLPAAAQ